MRLTPVYKSTFNYGRLNNLQGNQKSTDSIQSVPAKSNEDKITFRGFYCYGWPEPHCPDRRKEEEEKEPTIPEIYQEIISDKKEYSKYRRCWRKYTRKIYKQLSEEEKKAIVEKFKINFNMLYETHWRGYDDVDGDYDLLCPPIPASDIVRFNDDKESTVENLIQEREFYDTYYHGHATRYSSPLYEVIKNEHLDGLFNILDELNDYPKLQYKLLTSNIISDCHYDCDFTVEGRNVIFRIDNPGTDYDGFSIQKYAKISENLAQRYNFKGKDLERLGGIIDNLIKQPEISKEEADNLAAIYKQQMDNYHSGKIDGTTSN